MILKRILTPVITGMFMIGVVFAATQPVMAHAPTPDAYAINAHSKAMECDRNCVGARAGLDCLKHCLSSSATTPLSGAIAAPQFMKTYGATPHHFLLPKHRPVLSSGFIRPPPHAKRAWRDVHLKTQKRE